MTRPGVAAILVLSLSAGALAQEPPPSPASPAKEIDPRMAPPEKIEGTLPDAGTPTSLPPIYDEQADARKTIDAALAKAKTENRRVLIQWGANWCGWCRLLHNLCATDPAIRKTLSYEYDVVLVDVGHFDKNMDLAKGYGAELKGTGIPYLTVLSADGKVITNRETGALETKPTEADPKPKPSHDRAKVLGFLTAHQASYLRADAVLAEAREQAKASGRSVLVRWGAPWCPWCHRLDDWLARPEVAKLIAKDYVSVKIDEDRMTGGKQLLAAEGGGEGGIPWFAIEAGGTGTVVVNSDREGNNIGFPSEPQEIEHFMGMLQKTAKTLTPDDLSALRKTLEQEKTRTDAGRPGH
jgi:thiol-disulfide isomerase/thioredoxin